MEEKVQTSPWAARSQVTLPGAASLPWTHKTFGDRRPTLYRPEHQAGRDALHACSAAGNSSLRMDIPPGVHAQAGRLRFSWFVPALIAEADLNDGDVDDAVARVILTFGGDSGQSFSPRDHLISELARLVTGEPLPYATLIYVWDNRHPVGTVIPNPHTTRIRQIVVESGPARLGRWVDFERDVQADFRLAFGRAPGPLNSVGLLTDSNNTRTTAHAWYGPITLTVDHLTTAGRP
ncbi:MAG: DUF3047 domain-containing protein [Burkholderiales bacterium]|nr:MAG: DUF3047 domain-containing protein [Burkholderiales bacterium]